VTETPRRIWIEVLIVWTISAIAIRGAVQLGLSDTWVSIVKSLALIYLPVAILMRLRKDLDRYGLHLRDLKEAFALFAIVSIVTLIPFWGANHLWETLFLHHHFHLRWPPDFGSLAAGEVLAVGLPEEVFYRGYLQTRLDEAMPARRRILGADVGWALPIASVIFVAGHLVVRPALWELSIFFPSLVFGWMRIRSRGVVAPILYHALCNLGMLVLQRSYS
jgi:membrane protease YdiL (CAAX protease family)